MQQLVPIDLNRQRHLIKLGGVWIFQTLSHDVVNQRPLMPARSAT
jgi:hypothetical protein